MSEQYPGGFISKTEPTVNGSIARGLWTLSQAAGYKKQGLWPTSPGAPTIGTATAGDTSASVTFTAPANTGSAAITSYTVTSNPGGLTGTGASSPVTVSGLTNGTAYTFTVTATNAAGTGPASAASNSVTPSVPVYIEDLFNAYVYTGTGASNTITNNINLSANGGLVWIKQRNALVEHFLYDTTRGATKSLSTNDTTSEYTNGATLTAFGSSGFTLGSSNFVNGTTSAPRNYVSWTFREQPNFFDVVTWSGDNTAGRQISHSLGSVPGCIIVKRTTAANNWSTYHRSLGNTQQVFLNLTNATSTDSTYWNDTTPTSSVFTVGNSPNVNSSGQNYVAYLFAHDAGGFPASGGGSTNGITCGSYSVDALQTKVTVNLGYEPQWLMIKRATGGTGAWYMFDNMRGITTGGDDYQLQANSTGSEAALGPTDAISLTSTGFETGTNATVIQPSSTYIYVAIRRGPMKAPTVGTSVFGVGTRSGSGSVAKTNSNVLTDLTFIKNRTSGGEYWAWTPRLNGNLTLQSNSADANLTGAMADNPWDTMTGAFCGAGNGATNSGSLIDYSFSRAPNFFDVVSYTGAGGVRTVTHNLGAVPELMIVKIRNLPDYDWYVYSAAVGATKFTVLNSTAAPVTDVNAWNNTSPTSSVFTTGPGGEVNGNGNTYVAYLFATYAGISKVGSYTGTGALQTVNCGFTTGARFVLIKRVNSTGDWYVWDSARGLSSSTDPYLVLNTTAAEVTGTNYVDTDTTGFKVTAAAPAAINASGSTFIFLAIA
jgi:hypothetical protein